MGAGRLAVPNMFTVSPATLRHGIAFGVLFALTILFYNLAIASGPLSYTTFYFSASMLVPAFAGVLLFGEALTFTLAAAVALFLAAFWCLNVAPGGAQKPAKTLLPPCFWRAALWAAICCSPGWPGAWMPATCSRLYRAASLWA